VTSPPDYPDPAVIARLALPAAHPHDPDAGAGLEAVQTHLSHVFLSRRHVYKFRKAVRLSFVDFSTREERNADCLREVALNRRLAPDVYLGVAPLLPDDAGLVVGEPRETLAGRTGPGGLVPEHCVVMRRLPAGRDALSLLEAGTLTPAQLERLAERMAVFHDAHTLGTPAPFDPDDWLARCTEPTEASFRAVAESGADGGAALPRARERAESFVREHAERFERRRSHGRAVDAHGDLHLQHVWFERDDADPLVIDCLEFDVRLRHIDVAAEVAFTAMDLGYRGHRELAELFLRRYARASGDFDLYNVVDFFVGYRAAVRAKVAAIAAGDPDIAEEQRRGAAESARRHVAFAADALARRPPGSLVLVGGIVGTGKSTLAEALAERLDAGPGVAVVSSDRLRKRRAGLSPDERTDSAPDAGLYAPDEVRRNYAALLEQARPVCASGRVAILDATWSSRAERHRAIALAAELGARPLFVEARCDAQIALERLRRRAQAGADPSDAGPERHAASVARFEPLEGDELVHRRVIPTDAPDWRDRLQAIADELRTAAA
jgi:aminoglycoside phosphotransferase family enzyme/predicted kinase